jgi:hypothetical protein
VRVLRPGPAGIAASFGAQSGLAPLASVPKPLRPRLAELQRLSGPGASLALAREPGGAIVAVLEGGEEALRHLRFSAAGRVARGRAQAALYVDTVEELPPF